MSSEKGYTLSLKILIKIIKKITKQDYNATWRFIAKSRTLYDWMYAKVHLVTPIEKAVYIWSPQCSSHGKDNEYSRDIKNLKNTHCNFKCFSKYGQNIVKKF